MNYASHLTFKRNKFEMAGNFDSTTFQLHVTSTVYFCNIYDIIYINGAI